MSVIVPVYNEVAHLDELLQAIQASPVKKEIIIVDDGSTDGTREKLQSLPPTENITVVFHEKNHGKGAAIRTALAYARGEYVLIQDSDLEYDPQDYRSCSILSKKAAPMSSMAFVLIVPNAACAFFLALNC